MVTIAKAANETLVTHRWALNKSLVTTSGLRLVAIAASWLLWSSCASVEREQQMLPRRTNGT